MIFLLFTAGLCALTHFSTAQELPMDDVIATEEGVQVMSLSNGVKTYVQTNVIPEGCCSLRVVLKTQAHGEEQFAFDGILDFTETVGPFFTFCREKIQNTAAAGGLPEKRCAFSYSDLPTFYGDYAREVAVIAVGDFDPAQMQGFIDQFFGDLVLRGKEEPFACAPAIEIGQDKTIAKVILSLSYPNLQHPIVTYRDLKESWTYLLLQELFQQRMEHCSRGIEEAWVHSHPRFFYPVNGYAFVSEESAELLLSFLLWQVEAIRNDGFFEDEFYMVQTKLINQLQYLELNSTQPDAIFLASYYVDQFLLGSCCLNYQNFLEASATLVEQIQSEDILSCLDSFFFDEHRQIRVMHPQCMHSELLTKERVEELIDKVASLSAFYRDSEMDEEEPFWIFDTSEMDSSKISNWAESEEKLASVNLINSHMDAPFLLAENSRGSAMTHLINSTESFFGLPLDDREKRFIHSIISIIAEKNLVQLVFERGNLEKKGKKIHHVHPLRFMGYILSSSDLKSKVRSIRKSSFKWDAFIDGFSKRMREESSKGNVLQHVPGFAAQVGSTPEHVNEYIHRKDFEGLVKSLL